MNVSRLVSVVAAVAISAIQWAALFSPALHAQSLRPVVAPVASEERDDSLPVVVVTANRHS
jgi:hypothetical protein